MEKTERQQEIEKLSIELTTKHLVYDKFLKELVSNEILLKRVIDAVETAYVWAREHLINESNAEKLKVSEVEKLNELPKE